MRFSSLSSLTQGFTTKGFVSSAFAHASAALLLAGVSWSAIQPPTFSGQREVLSVQASWAAESPPAEAVEFEPMPVADPVLITPSAAEIERHRYHETAASDVRFKLDVPEVEVVASDNAVVSIRFARAADSAPSSTKPSSAAVVERQKAIAASPPISSVAAPPPQVAGNTATSLPSFAGNRPPNYPEMARRNGWEGTVLLQLTIDVTGQVTDVAVIQSSGHPVLDAEAVQAVRAWKGAPAKRGNTPVATVVQFPIRFRL